MHLSRNNTLLPDGKRDLKIVPAAFIKDAFPDDTMKSYAEIIRRIYQNDCFV